MKRDLKATQPEGDISIGVAGVTLLLAFDTNPEVPLTRVQRARDISTLDTLLAKL